MFLRNGEQPPKLIEVERPESAYYARKDIENKMNVTIMTSIRWEREGVLKHEKMDAVYMLGLKLIIFSK